MRAFPRHFEGLVGGNSGLRVVAWPRGSLVAVEVDDDEVDTKHLDVLAQDASGTKFSGCYPSPSLCNLMLA